MTKGWGVFVGVSVAVGALALLTFGTLETRCQSQQNAYRAQAAKQNARHEVSEFAFDRGWLPCLVERETADPQARNATEKEKRDLAAQEAVAGLAFWVGLIAFLQLIATIVGLFFVKRTLDATWEAVKDTGDATKAMQDANTLSRELAAADLRPWIVIEPRVTEIAIDELGIKLRYQITFRNIGKTSAARLWNDMTTRVLEEGDPLEQVEAFYSEWERAKRYTAKRTLLPGEEYIARGASGHSRIFWEAWSDDTRRCTLVVIASCVYWSPISKEWHRTERSFAIGEKAGKGLLDQWVLRDTMIGEWDTEAASETFAVSQFLAGATT